MLRKHFGFTLIEILVVIAIMGILSAVVLANLGEGQAQARDAERKADLRSLQSALELYKLKHGRYPTGCNGPGVWSGQLGTNYRCNNNTGIYAAFSGTAQYIIGHEVGISFAPEFITVLPIDPRLNGPESGYVYTTNAEGSVYKIMARLTVESETVTIENDFKSCDIESSGSICNNADPITFNRPTHCEPNNEIFQSTYALWEGFATTGNIVRNTQAIICNVR